MTRVRTGQTTSDGFQVGALAGLERRETAVQHSGATFYTDSCATSACTCRTSSKSFVTQKQTSVRGALSPVCPCQSEGNPVLAALCPATPAWLVDTLDQGLFHIAPQINITRLHRPGHLPSACKQMDPSGAGRKRSVPRLQRQLLQMRLSQLESCQNQPSG